MAAARDQIIEVMCTLLETQGYHATGLNQIIKESGTPKGSLYYYFPNGKEELAAEAIEHVSKLVAERIRLNLSTSDDVSEAVSTFIEKIADGVEASGAKAGGPLMIVAMETATTNELLNLACREAYGLLQSAFEHKLLASGIQQMRAQQLAVFILSCVEGAIILSRTQHSGEPLRIVAQELKQLLAD